MTAAVTDGLLHTAGRRLPLPYNLQTIMWAVGLRGAVAYGLAVNLPQLNEESNQGMEAIESATLVIVVISTIVFGGLTGERDHAPQDPVVVWHVLCCHFGR